MQIVIIVNTKPTTLQITKLVIVGAAVKWREIGTYLVDDKYVQQLNLIEDDHPNNKKECCDQMFRFWLNEYDQAATWRKLLNALKDVHLNTLAGEVLRGTSNFKLRICFYRYVAMYVKVLAN